MNKNHFKDKIYYTNLKEILMCIFITFFIYFLFLIFSFLNETIVSNLFKIINIIILIITIVFSIHIKKITGKRIFEFISFFLAVNIILIFLNLSPSGNFNLFNEILIDLGYKRISDFIYINIVIFHFLLSKYRINENLDRKIYFEYAFWISLNLIITFMCNKYKIIALDLIYYLYFIILFILTLKNLRITNFQLKNKIDLLRVNCFFIILKFINNIISKIFLISILDASSNILMNLILLSTIIGILLNIIQEDYKLMFKEAIGENKYLNDINRKIAKNNYNLIYTQKRLSDKQSMYKNFLGSLPIPIVIINKNHRISYCNVKFLEIIEVKNIREVVNRRIDFYINFKNKINIEMLWDNDRRPYTITIDLNDKKVEIRFFNLNTDDFEFILIFKDLTEAVKLSDMKEELEDIKIREQMKKNFLANISHDLKIPVNVIYSAIQLEKLLINKNDIQKIKDYNEIIKENCLMLSKFTNNLIDMSKIDSENLEVNLCLDNIVQFIEDYLFSLSTYMSSNGLNSTFDTDKEEIYIYFDKELMQRIILNLVSNSIKFTDEGGKIFVKINDFNDCITIELKDNGIGMSDEFISKAFNKYEMEHRYKENKNKGFGVGLFVVYNLIKAQEGDIEIQSEVGKGTNFIIKLYKKRVL